MTRILVADDHPMFRAAIMMAAQRVAPNAEIVEAGTLATALAAGQAGAFDLILLDLKMPGSDGYSGVALLHAEMPETPILVVSSAEAAKAAAVVLRFGAVGFVSKEQDLPAIEAAIAAALAGTRSETDIETQLDGVAIQLGELTPMQLRVLMGVLAGQSNKQIAFQLAITEATVKAHMTAVMRKLDVQNRTQAALAAKALGLAL